jgi:hypothetical protein
VCLLYPLVVATAVVASAAGAHWEAGPHLRCLDARGAAVLGRALAASPTVGRLVSLLEASDLIVFVSTAQELSGLSARTRFMSAAKGARYVIVELEPRASRPELVAMLGHELQHATEIAADPGVRDDGSMRRLFRRIGFAASAPNGYETAAALAAGRQVLRELTSGHGDEADDWPRPR